MIRRWSRGGRVEGRPRPANPRGRRARAVPARRWLVASFIAASWFLATAHPYGVWAKDHKAFAALSAKLSEQAGHFDSDNLISNETSYLHVLGKMREIGVQGGVYIGVGPDQNFSYIAKIRPRMAFMVDIRRDALLQHLLYKALFEMSRNRVEYLCNFFAKPLPKNKGWEQRTVADLVDYIDKTPADPKLFEKVHGKIRSDIQTYGIMLSSTDLDVISRIHRAFFTAGLDIRYSSYNRPPRSIYPAYRDLLLQRDLDGQMNNYFNSENDFQFIKRMHGQDLIVPVVGDLSGPQAMKAIARQVSDMKEKVSAFYVSNVEFYLDRHGTYDRFFENVKSMPIDSRSVIIRSYFNYYAPQHPMAEPDHFSTQLLQKIEDLIKQCESGGCENYADITTRNLIRLR